VVSERTRSQYKITATNTTAADTSNNLHSHLSVLSIASPYARRASCHDSSRTIAVGRRADPERIYQAGESWTEKPGDHHQVSHNASNTAPSKLLAIFVVDTNDREIVVPDK